MKTISLNGTELALKPFTFAQLRDNEAVLEALTSEEKLTGLKRTQDAVAVLQAVFPEVPATAFEPIAPGVLRQAAADVYLLTFKRPEGEGEAPSAASV